MRRWLSAALVLFCLFGCAQAEDFQLVFYGDWDQIRTRSYQADLSDLFECTYPRLYARWGTEQSPETVLFKADAEDHTSVAYAYSNRVVVSVDFANRKPQDRGYFAHELTHMVKSYGDKIEYNENTWWVENMADYDPDNGEAGTIRLYEFMLFEK